MIGDHHGRTAGRATLLLRAMDEILGTHNINPPVVHRVIQGAVTAPVLRRQGQPGQGSHRPVPAQRRIGQLGQLIGAGGQAGMKVQPEPRQHGEWPGTSILWQAVHHGLRSDHVSFGENK
jgi:hypothetical protein